MSKRDGSVAGVPFSVSEASWADRFSLEEWEGFKLEVREAVAANDQKFRRLFGTSRYRSPSFEFARRLRHHSKLIDLDAEEAADVVSDALGELFEQDKEEFLWENLIGHNDTEGQQCDPYSDFLHCWDACATVTSPLATAVAEARERNLPRDYFGPKLAGMLSAKFRLFLGVCETLQERAGKEPIFVSTTGLASAMTTSPMQVSRWRSRAVALGFLTLTSASQPGKAAEFLYHRPVTGRAEAS